MVGRIGKERKLKKLISHLPTELQLLENRVLMASDPLGVTLAKGLLAVNGSKFDDQIVVSYNGSGYVITNGSWTVTKTGVISKLIVNGKAGNDSVTIQTSVTIPTTLLGDIGNDTLAASNSNTSLNGGAGDDSLTGGDGNDILAGDAGNDVIVTGAGNHTVSGGLGDDNITAGDGNDVLNGDAGNDIIVAGNGNNTLNGAAGNDSLTGGTGTDSLTGGLGNDTMSGGSGIDTLNYADHTVKQGIIISLNGQTTGGMVGETDSLAGDFEIVYGSAGNDSITGSDNNDYIYGVAGNDTLVGGDGNDRIDGGAGNDSISGEDGNDTLIGAAGNDLMDGGAGEDLLLSIGGGVLDTVTGGADDDMFWMDSNTTELLTDASMNETSIGAVHRVAAFANKISKELGALAIADPKLTSASIKYRNFKANPLFSSSGPSLDDIKQGQLGDCYFLAQIGSFAKLNQNVIEQSIVDFGDGTYGVQFVKNGAKVFYRLDADLPSTSVSNLAYAAFGAESSIWVAMLEKAWTHFRRGLNTYASIEAGFMTEVASAFGKTSNWGYLNSNPNAVLAALKADFDAGKSLTCGTGTSPQGSLLVSGHAYTIDSITDDGNGNFTVVVRNPWAIDGYSSADGQQDGYITMTGTQFLAWTLAYAVSAT